MPLSDAHVGRAVAAMQAYLSAPRREDGSTVLEHYRQQHQRRAAVIENELKPLLREYAKGAVRLASFKSRVDNINKRNNLWGFNGAKGQMFFNMIVKVAKNEAECDRAIKSAIQVPETERMASIQIEDLCNYVTKVGERHVDSGGSLQERPRPGSVPFFVSYFWQIQDRLVWPMYHTNSVKKMSELDLWHPTGNLGLDYVGYKRTQEELVDALSRASGLAFSFYDVEHMFWVQGQHPYRDNMSASAATEAGGGKARVGKKTPSLATHAEVPPLRPHERASIETESQDFTEVEELEEDESSVIDEPDVEGAFEKRKLFTDKSDPPVGSLQVAWKAGDLVLDPIFQRRKVWDDGRSSRLIESVILEVPLPVFYFAESQDGTREVIDGQQRLTAFFRFLDNEYALSSLRALPALNGRFFRDLDKSTQRAIRDCAVRVVLFKKPRWTPQNRPYVDRANPAKGVSAQGRMCCSAFPPGEQAA